MCWNSFNRTQKIHTSVIQHSIQLKCVAAAPNTIYRTEKKGERDKSRSKYKGKTVTMHTELRVFEYREGAKHKRNASMENNTHKNVEKMYGEIINLWQACSFSGFDIFFCALTANVQSILYTEECVSALSVIVFVHLYYFMHTETDTHIYEPRKELLYVYWIEEYKNNLPCNFSFIIPRNRFEYAFQ